LTRGVSISNLGTNPSTTPFFERGLQREREQSLLIGQTHAGPLLKTLSVSLAMSLAFSVSAL